MISVIELSWHPRKNYYTAFCYIPQCYRHVRSQAPEVYVVSAAEIGRESSHASLRRSRRYSNFAYCCCSCCTVSDTSIITVGRAKRGHAYWDAAKIRLDIDDNLTHDPVALMEFLRLFAPRFFLREGAHTVTGRTNFMLLLQWQT